jgi:flagellar biosynthesis/type III secretory pathway protein FliH
MTFRSFLKDNPRRSGFKAAFSTGPETPNDIEPSVEVDSDALVSTPTLPSSSPADPALEQAQATIASQSEHIHELEQQLSAVKPVMAELPSLRRQIARDAATDVGEILSAVTRRIVGQSLALHPSALAHIVTQALGAIPGDDEIWISLPEGSLEEIQTLFDEGRILHMREDDTLTTGCRISTKNATLEATLDTAMESVDAAIAEWLASDPTLGAEG